MRFERGRCYFAVPCVDGTRKLLVQVVGRRGGSVLFSAVKPIDTEWVEWYDGREVAKVRDGGEEYTISAAVKIDEELAHDIIEATRPDTTKGLPRVARRGIFCKNQGDHQ